MSSGMAFTFTVSGDSLEMNAGGTIAPLLYEGVKEGHPRFYVAIVDGEIEFAPDSSGAMTTVLHTSMEMNRAVSVIEAEWR
jgi:hypothetical protein